jgi:chemotaxis protein MotA
MIINWLGMVMGIASILVGNAIEGGHISALIQPTAAMIVFGGTLGATLLSITSAEFKGALGGLKKVLLGGGPKLESIVQELIELATAARKDGVLSLEKQVASVSNHFLSSNLRHIIDGYDPAVLKEIMEDQMHKEEEEKMATAKVWETAGGYSPTIGILGAVLGLIHVMANLSDSSKLGSGIAVAFVATVYGVGAANLLLLPIGNKLKKIGKAEGVEHELIYIGLCGIQDGLNPRVIEDRLKNMLGQHGGDHGGGGAEQKKAA